MHPFSLGPLMHDGKHNPTPVKLEQHKRIQQQLILFYVSALS